MEVNSDWWKGEGPLGRGIFPSNYVRKIEGPTSEKGAYGPPSAPYGGGGGYNPGQPYGQPQQQPQQQQPMYGQPVPYQPQQQEPVKEDKKQSKLGEFGKNYGKTFVNATAW